MPILPIITTISLTCRSHLSPPRWVYGVRITFPLITHPNLLILFYFFLVLHRWDVCGGINVSIGLSINNLSGCLLVILFGGKILPEPEELPQDECVELSSYCCPHGWDPSTHSAFHHHQSLSSAGSSVPICPFSLCCRFGRRG